MTPLFTKLNLKPHTPIVVLQGPASFEGELAALSGVEVLRALPPSGAVPFALAFVTRQAEVDSLARDLAARAEGDAILWFAYPKQSSRKYACDFNRDTGWAVLGQAGFEPVRMVAIDADWSALRFRRTAFIKTLTRPRKLTSS